MSENNLKNGYIGYEAMGKPIPFHRRQAAYDTCIEYGCDAKTASDIISQMAKSLEHNKPHEALLSVKRDVTGVTIVKAYKLIAVLMTEDI